MVAIPRLIAGMKCKFVMIPRETTAPVKNSQRLLPELSSAIRKNNTKLVEKNGKLFGFQAKRANVVNSTDTLASRDNPKATDSETNLLRRKNKIGKKAIPKKRSGYAKLSGLSPNILAEAY